MEFIKMLYFVVLETLLAYPVFFSTIIGIALLSLMWRLTHRGKAKRKLAALITLIAGVIGFFALPKVFNSSISELAYSLDWLFHFAMLAGLMLYVFLVVWFFSASKQSA